MNKFRWLKYLAAFAIAPFIFKGIERELGPFEPNRVCTSCHSMRPFAEEYKKSIHNFGRSGVKAGCIDCHLDGGLVSFGGVRLLIRDSVREFLAPIKTKEGLEERRPGLAKKVRDKLVETKSKRCFKCHVEDAIVPTKDRGKNAHTTAKEKGKTCIECHYNLVHAEVAWEKEKKKEEGEPGLDEGTGGEKEGEEEL